MPRRRAYMRKKPVAIRGVIIPADWDEAGNVTEVAISAQNEVEYRIDLVARGKELMAFLNREVEVSGKVAESRQGKTIVIIDYSLL
jgi:hypothetical protein